MNKHNLSIWRWIVRQPYRTTIRTLAVVVFISFVWILALVLAGGLSHLNPGLLLLPVVITGFMFGPLAGIAIAVGIGLAIGPWMPASPGVPQPSADWLVRILAYAAVGGVVGTLSLRMHRRTRRTIDRQRALLKATPEIIERERIKALREMSRGVVHDFNNALAPILGFSEMLTSSDVAKDPDKVVYYARAINTAGANASEVGKRLRAFYQENGQSVPLIPVDLAEIVDQSLSMTEARWKSQARADNAEIVIEIDCPEDLIVIGNDAELRGVLTNLIFNAVDAMPEGGRLSFSGERTDRYIALRVSDTGRGMNEAALHRCTEAYFTTKENGTGLGISIVAAIMRYHGGKLEIESAPGEGTRMSLLFPIPEPEKTGEPAEREALPELAPLEILVVEDDGLVRQMLEDMLTSRGHRLTAAEDGKSALDIFHPNPDRFDVVISDTAMPGVSGRNLVLRIRRIRGDTPVIMLSGFDSDLGDPPPEEEAATIILKKPVTLLDLDKALWRATKSKATSRRPDTDTTS